MDVLLSGVAEALIERADDRFGRAGAWLVAILAVVALTIGALAVAVLVGVAGYVRAPVDHRGVEPMAPPR